MPRQPRPWYRNDRDAWFVTIDGTRHNLGPERKTAHDLFYQLMAHPQKRVAPSGSIVELIDKFLEWCYKHRAADTYEWYRFRLQSFAQTYPGLQTSQLKPFHVQEWLDSFDLSTGSKRNYCRAIKRSMRWASQQGYIDQNPIAHLEQPEGGKRDVVVSKEEFHEMLALIPCSRFRDLLTVTWETGCRPQESLRFEARHLDANNSRWVMPLAESKGKSLSRVIYLTDVALCISKRLAFDHPNGKLFRNSKGKPWTPDSVSCAFNRLQIRMGKKIMRDRAVCVDNEAIENLIPHLASEHIVSGKMVAKRPAELSAEAKRKLTNRLACSLVPKLSLYVL